MAACVAPARRRNVTDPSQQEPSRSRTPEHWLSTPIWVRRLADQRRINTDILAFVDELDVTTPAITRSNVGGWHSHDKLHSTKQLSELTGIIGATCARCAHFLDFDFGNFDLIITQMWMNKNGPGDFNKLHVHPNSFLSGAYYVRMPPQGGNIEFYDPVPARAMIGFPTRAAGNGTASSVAFTSEEGMLLVFPSWLQHSVQPNRSNDVRISISFNVAYRAKSRSSPKQQKDQA